MHKKNARQSTLTINQDGITINGATWPNTFMISNAGMVSFEQMINAVGDLGKALIACPYPDTNVKLLPKKDNTQVEFHPLLCTRCGGNLAFKNEFLVCEYCGTVYSSDLSISEKPQVCYISKNKCVTCGHSITATTMDDSEPVYICSSMNGCIYKEEE